MKRLPALLLSIAVLLALLPADVLAVDTMTTSSEGLAFIQDFEGYEEYAYQDGGEWYIGYGTQCERDEYPYGISREEAEELMVEHLADQEERVNVFLNEHQVHLEQHQFDALMSLTYNLGTSWINPTYRLCQYLMAGIENYSEEEVVNAIGTWCHVGDEPVKGLAQRRLKEAYLFLYGDYDNTADEAYVYLHFDVGDGEIEHSTVFYPSTSPIPCCLPPPARGSISRAGTTTAASSAPRTILPRATSPSPPGGGGQRWRTWGWTPPPGTTPLWMCGRGTGSTTM